MSAHCCKSGIALRASQFGDGVGGQFGGALWLFCPVLIVDRKLFRGLDSGFERFLCVFQSNGRFFALGRCWCLAQFFPERCRASVILLALRKLGQFALREPFNVSW